MYVRAFIYCANNIEIAVLVLCIGVLQAQLNWGIFYYCT